MTKFILELNLSTKLSLLVLSVVFICTSTLFSLVVLQSHTYGKLAQHEVDQLIDEDLKHMTESLYALIESQYNEMLEHTRRNLEIAATIFEAEGGITLSSETMSWQATNQLTNETQNVVLPKVLVNGKWIGAIRDPSTLSPVIDRISYVVDESATIFQKMNANWDMLRIATTVRNSNEERAIGTFVSAVDPDGKPNAIIDAISRGKPFLGKAFVVNSWYLAAYKPIFDDSNQIIGMLYVGSKIENMVERIKHASYRTIAGKAGYAYVLGAMGTDRGRYIISNAGLRDGENIWDAKDDLGNYVVHSIIEKAMLAPPQHTEKVRYRWKNPGDFSYRWKLARVAYFAPLNWVIGVGAYEDELQPYSASLSLGRTNMMRNMAIASIFLAIGLGSAGIWFGYTIVKPLKQMTAAVDKLVGGDLSQVIDVAHHDEIGILASAFNKMTNRLRLTIDGLLRSKEELRAAKNQSENIIEFLPDAIVSIDNTGKVTGWNRAMEEMTNIPKSDVIGKESKFGMKYLLGEPKSSFFELLDAPIEALVNSFPNAQRKGNIWRFEDFVPQLYAGKGAHISAVASRIFGKEGEPVGAIASIRDISENKSIEQQARSTNERFKSIVSAARAYSIIGTDNTGTIKVFNEGAELMFGYREDEVINVRSPVSLFDPAEIEQRALELGAQSGLDAMVDHAKKGLTETREWTAVCKNDSRMQVSLTTGPIFSDSGELTGFVFVARDLTSEKHLEQQLLQSQKMETVGFLAGGIAHDFNNLLTPIIGYTELLLARSQPTDHNYPALRNIHEAAGRARELTNRLLIFSRKQIMDLRVINLGEVVSKFQGILRLTIRENVWIDIQIDPDLDLVRADAGQIEQVLANLSINAQDAMPSGGALSIILTNFIADKSYCSLHPEISEGRYVLLTVKDTGIGMTPETLKHIFEPFYSTKEVGKGTGLGMSTTYGIIKKHGGSIDVYSESTKGTVVRIFLPSLQGAIAEKSIESDRSPIYRGGTETIMVVEDNEMVRTLTCNMLAELGYRVISADGAESGINLAQEYKEVIDLLLVDVIMPHMNGKEVYQVIKSSKPNLSVVYFSGYSSDVISSHGILNEGTYFIQKPFTIQSLSTKIREVLDHKAQLS